MAVVEQGNLPSNLGYTIEEPKAEATLKQVRINILDPKTKEAVEEVDVYTSAESVKFNSSKRDLPAEMAHQLAYTNTNKMPATIGGLKEGTTFVEQNVKKIFDTLFYPYTPPIVTLQANNKDIFFEEGVNIAPIVFEINVGKRSEEIKSAALYRSGMNVTDLTINPEGEIIKYTYASIINKDCEMNVKVFDKSGVSVVSNVLKFRFNKPIYIGVVDTDAVITETLVKTLHKEVVYDLTSGQASNEITTKFVLDEQSFFYAFPAAIVNPIIYDQNGFDITNSFTKGAITIPNPDGTKSDDYTFLISNKTSQTGFNLTFKIIPTK